MKIGLVVPHVFMHEEILGRVIFSPGWLALDLARGLARRGHEVTLFSPGPVTVSDGVRNVTADLSYFERELMGRGDSYIDLLKKHPMTFVTLARQVQAELLARAYEMANAGELDIVHVYTNEEELGCVFAGLCRRPVVFTHHDPFNFLVKYKSVFPKYAHLPWISMSMAQRKGMPEGANWVGNVYHGLDEDVWGAEAGGDGGMDGGEVAAGAGYVGYAAFVGRIIEAKGVHLAIAAVRAYNATHPGARLQLRIAGKHYAGIGKDVYWRERIEPLIDGEEIRYVGFIGDVIAKQRFLRAARALVVPSVFEEPFGMVMIEALACGTPVVGLDVGAIGEVVRDDVTGAVVPVVWSWDDVRRRHEVAEDETVAGLGLGLERVLGMDRREVANVCRREFEERFTLSRMVAEHEGIYGRLLG